jgi:hypothetical protein
VVRRHLAGQEDNSAIVYALASFQEWYGLFMGGGKPWDGVARENDQTAAPAQLVGVGS